VNDKSLELVKEIYVPLNAQLLSKEIEMNFPKSKMVLPALYSTLIDKASADSVA